MSTVVYRDEGINDPKDSKQIEVRIEPPMACEPGFCRMPLQELETDDAIQHAVNAIDYEIDEDGLLDAINDGIDGVTPIDAAYHAHIVVIGHNPETCPRSFAVRAS